MTLQEWLAANSPDLSHIREIARGGQKVVFAATHKNEGDVVIKVIKPGQDLERVHREVLAVGQLLSRRVPRILAVERAAPPDGPIVWLREQYIPGQTLRQHLHAGPLPPRDVALLGLQALEVLSDAERARIVHRDVKPDNIMRDPSGEYWMLDFGLARHLDLTSLTASSALAGPGTLGYAPPEQLRNRKRDLDARADLFALAVTMVECLTGRHPYRDGARDAAEVARRIERGTLVVPTIPGDAGGHLQELIATMGQRRVDCRPASAVAAMTWMKEIYERAPHQTPWNCGITPACTWRIGAFNAASRWGVVRWTFIFSSAME